MRFFYEYSPQLVPLVTSKWLNPVHLTQENVTWFRNRAAHDSPMNAIDASIGSYLAKRVLYVFYGPVLNAWGFKPTIIQQ